MQALPRLRQMDNPAARLRNLREAALADDTGKKLENALAELNLLTRSEAVKIVCLGGGPAGLYFSILLKKANPSWDVTVIERNRPTDTFGWGIVFSDKTMDGFRSADEETHAEITRAFRHWDDIDVFFKGAKITSGGHGFCGIARIKLLTDPAAARGRAWA